uniref:ARAD1D22902p n=1 Tax=Blastobotrys adeninivorans TaxID=409370 RepID=A0A060TAD1_BLAAD
MDENASVFGESELHVSHDSDSWNEFEDDYEPSRATPLLGSTVTQSQLKHAAREFLDERPGDSTPSPGPSYKHMREPVRAPVRDHSRQVSGSTIVNDDDHESKRPHRMNVWPTVVEDPSEASNTIGTPPPLNKVRPSHKGHDTTGNTDTQVNYTNGKQYSSDDELRALKEYLKSSAFGSQLLDSFGEGAEQAPQNRVSATAAPASKQTDSAGPSRQPGPAVNIPSESTNMNIPRPRDRNHSTSYPITNASTPPSRQPLNTKCRECEMSIASVTSADHSIGPEDLPNPKLYQRLHLDAVDQMSPTEAKNVIKNILTLLRVPLCKAPTTFPEIARYLFQEDPYYCFADTVHKIIYNQGMGDYNTDAEDRRCMKRMVDFLQAELD